MIPLLCGWEQGVQVGSRACVIKSAAHAARSQVPSNDALSLTGGA